MKGSPIVPQLRSHERLTITGRLGGENQSCVRSSCHCPRLSLSCRPCPHPPKHKLRRQTTPMCGWKTRTARAPCNGWRPRTPGLCRGWRMIRATRSSIAKRWRSPPPRTGFPIPTCSTAACSTFGATPGTPHGIWRVTSETDYGKPAAGLDDTARPRCARQGRGQGLGVEGRDLPATRGKAVPDRACRKAARMPSATASSIRWRASSSMAGSYCRRRSSESTGSTRTRYWSRPDWGTGTMTASAIRSWSRS